MSIKVKAIERKLKFEAGENGAFQYRYVMQPELYNKLTQAKVIQEAALRSGQTKGAVNAAWDAIGEVLKAWATEGHTVVIPGLGTMRFGLRSTSVDDVNKVAADLITSRRVIFTPNVDIKKELKNTSISITCIDRYGNVVKRVTSDDDADVEDPDADNGSENGEQSENGQSGENGNGSQGENGSENGQNQGSESGNAGEGGNGGENGNGGSDSGDGDE